MLRRRAIEETSHRRVREFAKVYALQLELCASTRASCSRERVWCTGPCHCAEIAYRWQDCAPSARYEWCLSKRNKLCPTILFRDGTTRKGRDLVLPLTRTSLKLRADAALSSARLLSYAAHVGHNLLCIKGHQNNSFVSCT
jgi:hypothetical protein